MESSFEQALSDVINRNRSNDYSDNYDFRRFGAAKAVALRVRLKHAIKGFLEIFGLRENPTHAALGSNKSELQWLYERLQDDESKKLLVEVMAYRVLGHRRIKLPLNTPAYWAKLDEIERKAITTDPIDLGFLGWKLNLNDLADEGYPIRVYARAPGVYTQMLLQQYRCVTPNQKIEVRVGDTVIDAGGCYGDTALCFAHKAGPGGRVFSFEFMPDNIQVFNRNLEMNPDLAERVEIVPHPLWSKSGEKLYVEGIGPAAHITPTQKTKDAKPVETLTIDDLARAKGLPHVDFIKMDIEGAELEALKGAEDSIRRFRPRLAISVYHRLPDFWEIAQWIDGLGLGYRFHLRHFTIHAEETVLFAEVSDKAI